jgi:hypothetical protein
LREEPDSHEHHLADAAGRLEQATHIGVEAGRRRRLDVADIVRIVMVRSDAEGVIDNVGGGEITALDPPMDRLRVVAIPR